jgi:hypothetical protein
MKKNSSCSDYSEEDDFIECAESTLRKRFMPEEDKLLKQCVHRGKLKTWEAISQLLPGRSARQCRDRYNNYLFKQISNAKWTEEEDQIILSMYEKIGSKWTKIAKSLHGRSGNNVKNRWYKFLSKKKTIKRFKEEPVLPVEEKPKVDDTNESLKIEPKEAPLMIEDFDNLEKIFDLDIFKDPTLSEQFDVFSI